MFFAQRGELCEMFDRELLSFRDDDALGCGLALVISLCNIFFRLRQLAFENFDGAAGGGNFRFKMISFESCSRKA